MTLAHVVCTECGGPIDEEMIGFKKRIAAALYPNGDVPAPKVCAKCRWMTFRLREGS